MRITGIGYRRGTYGRDIYPGGTGIRVAHLDSEGMPNGYEQVYPLGQLHLTTLAEFNEARRRVAEAVNTQRRQRQEEDSVWRARAERAQLAIGTGMVSTSYGTRPYLHLTVEQAEALAEKLNPA